jgi:hypothetical protein
MLCRFRFRLNGGFSAGFLRLNVYGFPVPFLSVYFLFLSVLLVPLIFLLAVYFSLSFSSGCVAFASLLLPIEWQLRSRLLMECFDVEIEE